MYAPPAGRVCALQPSWPTAWRTHLLISHLMLMLRPVQAGKVHEEVRGSALSAAGSPGEEGEEEAVLSPEEFKRMQLEVERLGK